VKKSTKKASAASKVKELDPKATVKGGRSPLQDLM
jgi:hypothetical protein